MIDRRRFLQSLIAGGALYSAGGMVLPGSMARADGFATLGSRLLVNVTLDGGPDMRHLLAPAYSSVTGSFGYEYWHAIANAHAMPEESAALQTRWENNYWHTAYGDTSFGILNSCGWLQTMWERGNVAIVCNAFGSRRREHDHAALVLDQGNQSTTRHDIQRSGWGGRLAEVTGGNVLALTRAPRNFCYSDNPDDPEGRLANAMINAPDTRSIRLFQPGDAETPDSHPARLARSLERYYTELRRQMPARSVNRPVVDMERTLRQFGEPIEQRLAGIPIPASLESLYSGDVPRLSAPYFGRQVRNLYDAIACNDILTMKLASLEFTGFDSHDDQAASVEPKFADMFGTGMAFDSLYQELPADARANTVLMFAGEFGRQIRANGDHGTDHGEGMMVMLVGEQVAGGVYGDMFPDEELARLTDASPEVRGLTGIEQIFARTANWLQQGSGDIVFPNRQLQPVEAGVQLANLFA